MRREGQVTGEILTSLNPQVQVAGPDETKPPRAKAVQTMHSPIHRHHFYGPWTYVVLSHISHFVDVPLHLFIYFIPIPPHFLTVS